ncbi:hypothetical protein [Streptomyces sp. NBC_01462]|uniref:hypothetical protein n=1 Tax=Streptomyces sp. NBC_01462 TaxID=2903876 RepID=UPI002E2ED13A|nr:hypothetical protein [Streptomyces sp. NBC_01462]
MRQRNTSFGRRHKAINVLAAVLASVVACGGVVWVARGLDRFLEGDPYPVADPAGTAQRLDGHTQHVYDALRLFDVELVDNWPGGGVEADGSSCYYRGFSNLSKQLSDSPPSVPGVVDVDSEWALKGVSPVEAKAALQRAKGELVRQGWKVTSYEESKFRNELSMRPPGTDDSVSVEAYPGDRLAVRAYAECARYPSGTPMGAYGDPELPSQQSPHQLRR